MTLGLHNYMESSAAPAVDLNTLECLAISDKPVFEAIMKSIGLPIIGVQTHDPLDKSVRSESIEAMASMITEDRDDNVMLDPARLAIKQLAEDYGYIVSVEEAPPGWKGGVESMKRDGMSDDKAFAIAWSSHNKGHKAPDTGKKPKKKKSS